MAKLTKNRKKALEKFNQTAPYDVAKASEILKQITSTKLDWTSM